MSDIFAPWPWWISGILIGLTVPLLYLLAGKAFGISTSLQQMGAMCTPQSKLDYFAKYDWRKGLWTLWFVIGIAIGGWIANNWLSNEPIEFLPAGLVTGYGWLRLLVGGFLVGFGARYAGGCTSGHSITGLANLNGPSLVATLAFFAGGLGVTWGLGAILFGGQR